MKVLCPACERLAEPGRLALDGETVVLTCARCGAQSRWTPPATPTPRPPPVSLPLPSPAGLSLVSAPGASNVISLRTSATAAAEDAAKQAASGSAFAVPDGACPKCLGRRAGGADACGHCGLVFALADEQALAPPAWLREAWTALLTRWGDDAEHERLRKEALAREGLIPLARMYRLRLAWMPEDPVAQRGRDEVVRLAAAPVNLGALESGSGGASAGSVPMLAFLTLLGAAIAALAWQLLRSGGE